MPIFSETLTSFIVVAENPGADLPATGAVTQGMFTLGDLSADGDAVALGAGDNGLFRGKSGAAGLAHVSPCRV
jgi:hypothetical protein